MADELTNLSVLPWEGRRNNPSVRKPRTRVGRGEGSGKGKTCGRGTKGAQSRSGYSRRWGFEGGQMPLHRRLPKRGFHNHFSLDLETINVGRLAGLEAGSVVTAESLKAAGTVSRIGRDGVKILGGGDLGVAIHVRVAKLTKSAAAKILAAGGTIEGPLPDEGGESTT